MKVSSFCCALLLVVQSSAAKSSNDTHFPFCRGRPAAGGGEAFNCASVDVTDCNLHYTTTSFGTFAQCGVSDENCLTTGPACVLVPPPGPKMIENETYLDFEPANAEDLSTSGEECSYTKFQDPEGKWYHARQKNCLGGQRPPAWKAWYAVGTDSKAVHAKRSDGEHYVIIEMPENMSIGVLGYWVTIRNLDQHDKGPRPTDWKFQASNGSTWVTLDEQDGFEFTRTEEYFELARPSHSLYKWFRFLVTRTRRCPDGGSACDDHDYILYESVKIRGGGLQASCHTFYTQETCPGTCVWKTNHCHGACAHSYSDQENCPSGYKANRNKSRSTLVTVDECCEEGL